MIYSIYTLTVTTCYHSDSSSNQAFQLLCATSDIILFMNCLDSVLVCIPFSSKIDYILDLSQSQTIKLIFAAMPYVHRIKELNTGWLIWNQVKQN